MLFIAGIGRSGTTLLEQALGQHADMVNLGETLHLWHRGLVLDERCGCGVPFGRCDFWQAVGQEAFGGWNRVDPDRLAELRSAVDHVRRIPALARRDLDPAWAERVREYAWHFGRVHAAARTVSGRSVVVDASKQISLAFCLSHLPVDLRVLHCVRDSRAVANSWSRVVARPDSDGDDDYMQRYPAHRIAVLWNLHNAAVPFLRRVDVPWLRSRYEDFAADPAGTVRRVAEFAGVDPDRFRPDSIGDGWLHLAPSHTVSGNPVRFSSGRIDVRADTRWRDELPGSQRRLVTAMTLPMMRRYGYPMREAG